MMRWLPLLACCALALPLQALAAQPVYKCSAGGKTTYGDKPCADGRGVVLPPPAAGVQLEEAARVPTQDARTLLELEKLRIAREREQDKQDERAARASAHAEKAATAKRKQCDRLRLRVKWADEDLARAHGRQRDAARIKARRAAEKMAVECPA